MIESGTCGPRTPNQRDHLAAPDSHPDCLRAKLRNIRGFVTERMQNLRTIMNSDIAHVRAELAKHIEKITLTPRGECYIASGTWNFVGRGSIGGAGGQNHSLSL